MAVTHSTAARSAATDAVTALIGASGRLRFRGAGTVSAPGTSFANLALSATAFPAAVSGTATANAITGVTASGSGTASYFRAYRSAGNGGGAVIDGDVATSGADMNIQNTSVNSGQALSVTSWTHTQPE